MSYTPTTWVNEVPTTTPVKYKVTDDSLGIVASSAKIEVISAITTTGTPVNATNLNHMETGIQNAQTDATAGIAAASAAQSTANTGVANAATAQTAANTAQTTANAAIPKSTAVAAGDLIVATAAGTLSRVAIGAGGTWLKSSGSAPVWAAYKQLSIINFTMASVPTDGLSSVTFGSVVLNEIGVAVNGGGSPDITLGQGTFFVSAQVIVGVAVAGVVGFKVADVKGQMTLANFGGGFNEFWVSGVYYTTTAGQHITVMGGQHGAGTATLTGQIQILRLN